VHIAFRFGQLRPQRKNRNSSTGLIIQCVDIRAPLAEPKMFDRMGVTPIHFTICFR
jgi:hypothetical protein